MTEDKAFWKFMDRKKYGCIFTLDRNYYIIYVVEEEMNAENMRPQMLIGFYQEYLAEHGIFISMANSCVDGKSFETIDQYAARLEKEIEAL